MNFKLHFLILFPPVYLSKDFLPEWFLWVIGLELVLLSLFKIPKILGYLNPLLIYFIFQSVGIQIIPETMIPTLCILILSQKIIDKEKNIDQAYFTFLWFGIFALFAVNLYYLSYSLIVFILFFVSQNSSSTTGIWSSISKYKKQLLLTFLIATALFIFFPRFNSFLPSANKNLQGKIGYSTDINNSSTANLNLSSNTAFYAELSKKLPTESLYWRGRIHTKTDGYNWRTLNVPSARSISNPTDGQQLVISKMKYEQDFNGDVILLDNPVKVIESNLRTYKVNSTNEFKLYRANKKVIITAESLIGQKKSTRVKLSQAELKHYLQLPAFTPKRLKSFLNNIKDHNSSKSIIEAFSRFIIEEEFSYTLSPGPLPTMNSFLIAKKGYCTHFASFLGVVLRLKSIPTRLVSGFQGGFYNQVGSFYEIRSNDAHAWVEYFENGVWLRVDPTAFISPDRIQFGGERFLTASRSENLSKSGQFSSFFYQSKQYFDNLDYKVSLFFDNFNKESQKNLSQKFKLTLQEFTYVGLLLVLLLVSIFYFLSHKKTKIKRHPMDAYLKKLDKYLKNKEKKTFNQKTIEQMNNIVIDSIKIQSEREIALNIINEYQKLRFSNYTNEKPIRDLFRRFL